MSFAIRYLTFAMVCWAVPNLLGQSGGDYAIIRGSIAGGGGAVSGEDYSLSGTSGQHDPGELTGDDYALTGGFWPAVCTCRLYGDTTLSLCVVDVDDILYVLDAFADPPSFPNGDIFPCGGNGVVDVDDILVELDAFSGTYACPHPCPP